MAFGLLRKRPGPAPQPAPTERAPLAIPDRSDTPASDAAADSAREILELLELEPVAMVRQLERAANSVASGAQSTAASLHNIRHRIEDLTGRNTRSYLIQSYARDMGSAW
jgi:methyl-accepting chemotaxis protein